jgi:N-acetylglutamate synthase
MMAPDVALPLERIRFYEECAFNAWPARQTVIYDGWVARFADGYTKRANSASALNPCGDIERVVSHTEHLYAARDMPSIFRLSPLADPSLDAYLERRGYQRADEAIVMIADGFDSVEPDDVAEITGRPSDPWNAVFRATSVVSINLQTAHDAIVAAIPVPAGFGVLLENGLPLSCGLAVAERGAVGLFDVATVPEGRRRGLARRLVLSLLGWGKSHHARTAYLQVVANNTPAIALYSSLGFRHAYSYHYRIR